VIFAQGWPRTRTVQDHVPIEQLLKVAADDDLLFMPEEFKHLKPCSDCFKRWSEFIGSLPSHERTQKAKALKQTNGR
jgi:hypothetical protein